MTVYTLRVGLAPNPPMFEPGENEEVWCDIEVDETHPLERVYEAIYEAFDRWDAHMNEFLPHDADGIATRRYVMPQTYSGEPSWPPMDSEEIEQAISRIGAEDASEEAKERFRNLRSDPPDEGNAAATTIADLNPEELNWLYYQFDFGDGWEHVIGIVDSLGGRSTAIHKSSRSMAPSPHSPPISTSNVAGRHRTGTRDCDHRPELGYVGDRSGEATASRLALLIEVRRRGGVSQRQFIVDVSRRPPAAIATYAGDDRVPTRESYLGGPW